MAHHNDGMVQGEGVEFEYLNNKDDMLCVIVRILEKFMLDVQDRRILKAYQQEPRASVAEMSDALGLSSAVLTRRLSEMRAQGLLGVSRAVIDWRALGYEVEVSLRITLDKSSPRAFDECIAAARGIREVIEIQTFLGQVDLRLGVVAFDMAHYQQLYREHILALPHIADLEALMHVGRVKYDRDLPL